MTALSILNIKFRLKYFNNILHLSHHSLQQMTTLVQSQLKTMNVIKLTVHVSLV